MKGWTRVHRPLNNEEKSTHSAEDWRLMAHKLATAALDCLNNHNSAEMGIIESDIRKYRLMCDRDDKRSAFEKEQGI